MHQNTIYIAHQTWAHMFPGLDSQRFFPNPCKMCRDNGIRLLEDGDELGTVELTWIPADQMLNAHQ